MSDKQVKSGWAAVAFSAPLVKRSIKTAMVVGTILVLINQWPSFTSQTPINWISLVLTYLVPYCVSTYSGTVTALSQGRQ